MIYLLLANLYLCIFYGFYHLFLQKQTFFQWNRVYLIIGLLLAFTLPLVEFQDLDTYTVGYQQYLPVIYVDEPVAVQGAAVTQQPATAISAEKVLLYSYFGGCMVSLLMFVFSVFRTLRMLGSKIQGDAYSFFGAIRVDHEMNGYEKIRRHEQVHAREWHSVDIVLVQLAKIFNWFNPIVYVYERAIKLQHEYIADGRTAANDQMRYAELLVSRAMGINGPLLANPFSNKRLLKRRITMLLREKSPRSSLLRYTMLLPILVAMVIFSIACNQGNGSKQNNDVAAATGDEANVTDFKSVLAQNIVYSREALQNNNQGFLAVTYEKADEGLKNIRFLNEFGDGQEAEVIRAFQLEAVEQLAPAGKNILIINFKIHGIESEDMPPPPPPVSPEYAQLGDLVILAYAADLPPPPPPVEPPPPRVEQVRMPELKEKNDDSKENKDQEKLPPPQIVPAQTTDEKFTPPSVVSIRIVEQQQQPQTDDRDARDMVFQSVEINPEPSGGMRAFMDYVARNYQYPKAALEHGVNGQVQVSFIVEADGQLTDFKVIRDLGYGTGEAAVRLLQSSSKWSPGIQNGRPVRTAYTLPIRLNLQS